MYNYFFEQICLNLTKLFIYKIRAVCNMSKKNIDM